MDSEGAGPESPAEVAPGTDRTDADGRGGAPVRAGLAKHVGRWAWLLAFIVGFVIEILRQQYTVTGKPGSLAKLTQDFWPHAAWFAPVWIADGLILGLAGGSVWQGLMGLGVGLFAAGGYAAIWGSIAAPGKALLRWLLISVPGAIAGAGISRVWGMKVSTMGSAAFWGALCVLIGLGAERLTIFALDGSLREAFASWPAESVSIVLRSVYTGVFNAFAVGVLVLDLNRIRSYSAAAPRRPAAG